MMIGETIRQKRQMSGYTQKRFGEMLGYKGDVAQVIVARWEAGTRPIPQDKLKLVAKLLEIPLEDLLP